MEISAQDARGLYTRMIVDVYSERIMSTSFLRSFFRNVESATKLISIEVKRGFEKVAVDVIRGTGGNRNTFVNSTEKTFLPPLYDEYFDATELDIYDRIATGGSVDPVIFAQFLDTVADKLVALTEKIERAYEVQASQVFEDGIVTVEAGTNIDFKRLADSKVDAAGLGGYWTTAVDPNVILETGAEFIRTKGKSRGGIFNILMGTEVLNAYYNNDNVKDRAKMVQYGLDQMRPAQRDSVGGVLHGQISFGSWKGNVWTYPEFYDNTSNESTPYLNPKKLVMLPENPEFVMSFAAVPQLIDGSAQPKKGAYLAYEHKDYENAVHKMGIKSAGLTVPTAVDQLFTAQVVGS